MHTAKPLAIAATLALTASLAACGGSGGGGGGSSSSSQSASGLTLTQVTRAAVGDIDAVAWNLPYEPSTIDPSHSFNYSENTVIANMCESLLRQNPDFSTSPALAKSVDHPNPTTWIYHLQENVKFWDGKPMTSQDVAYSLNRGLDPDVGSYFGSYFTNVKDIKATDASTVTVTMKAPDVLFNQAMSTAAGAVVQEAYTKSAGKDFGSPSKGVMCTGPFTFDSWKSGDSLVMSRNDAYWDSPLKAKAGKLTFRFISDETTAVNALQSGEIDGEFFYLPPAGLSSLKSSDAGTLYYGDSLIFWALLGSAETGPMADPKVRQAFSLAVDRPGMAKVVFQDAAEPAKALTNPAYFTYGKPIFQAAYDALPSIKPDLEKAQQLLKEAGSPTQPITIAIQGSSAVHEQTGALLKAAGEALGLTVNIKSIPVEQYGAIYYDPKAREGIDAFLSTWYGNVPDPLDVYAAFVKGGPNNFNNYDAVSSQVEKARTIDNDDERATQVSQIMTTVTNDAPWVPLETLPVLAFLNKRVTGATVSSVYLYYPWAAALGKSG
ncbi:MAG: ABC transporter substrate-binding protein [Actinobacteria bacterium]|nr:ABC transporter substrate-binding protein [Actinomycetota bacterium]